MGFLSGFGARTKDRVAREAENWRAPRTMGGQNISLVEAIYYGAVLLAALLLAGLVQKSSMGQIVVFGAAVVALSAHVRRSAIPAVYDAMAPKFGWQPFSEAIRGELGAAGAAKSAAAPQAVSAPMPGVTEPEAVQPTDRVPEAAARTSVVDDEVKPEQSREILRVFAGLPQPDRRARSLQVIAFMKSSGGDFPGVEQVPDEQERRIVAEYALLDLARKEGVA